MKLKLFLLLTLTPLVGYGQQLTVAPKVVPIGQPIIAEITGLPDLKDGQTREVIYDYKGGRYEIGGATYKQALWAAPGEWDVIASVHTVTQETFLALIPGPNFKNDKADYTTKEITVKTGDETIRLADKFKQEGLTPGPGPNPDPQPDPDHPAPIPENKLNVMVIEETEDRDELAKSPQGYNQIVAMQSTLWRNYVKSKGGEFMHIDKDSTLEMAAKKWQDAMKRPRTQLPWLIISNGKSGYEGPVPQLDEFMKLVQKFGG
jgi:hypothetical protein